MSEDNTRPEFLIEKLLPANEIHLLAGPSGAGKTRWLIQMLKNEWERGFPVLGYHSNPVPWCYIGSDRSTKSVRRTISDIGIDPDTINIIPCWGRDRKTMAGIEQVIEDSGAYLAVIEGFAGFCDGDNSHHVRNFLCTVQAWIQHKNLTIIGVVESPKMKPYERYENPRQRVSGAAAWAHYSDTIMLVEPRDSRHPKLPDRILHICPRNASALEVHGGFTEDGRLIFDTAGIQKPEDMMGEPQVNPFKRVN
ncbi:AAA family ATPase [Candidatus Bathyarchaeota archaeon]|nr:AAA family ATPase [Candidatus Bathyarchaeota archaeon]